MRYLTFCILCFFTLVNCEHSSELHVEEEAEGSKEIPSDWFYAQRAYPHGKIDKTAFIDALLQKKEHSKTQVLSRSDENWEFVGPTNIGGRVTDIEMHSSSTETIYVGTASGGIFKSEDRAVSFTPIFDDALSLSIGDMDIAKSDPNIIYVGTGEANAGGGSLAYDGVGVYRSNDAGASWTHLGLEGAGSIGKVQVHPTDPNTVFVGTMGNLFANDGQRGLFKSNDGGTTWDNVLLVSDSTGVIDVVIHPTNPNTIFAATWERIRRPNRRAYAGATSGIFRSDDGGDTWTELLKGLPQANNLKGRIGLAIAPSQPNIVYAVYAGEDGFISGSFRSIDSGNSWQPFNNQGIDDVPFMWWFGKITVHPQRPDELYYLSLNTFKTVDVNTQAWNIFFPGQHVDQHDLFIHPTDPSIIVSANDGGVYISDNAGASFTHANTLPITQFYECEINPTNPDQVYGGAQDNGTNTTLGGPASWQNLFGGDGFTTIADPSGSDIVYLSVQRGAFFRRTSTGNISNISPTLGPDDRTNWNSPSVLDPFDSSTLYFGTSRLLKSTNQGNSWQAISPDLSNGLAPNSNLAFGTITTISPSPVQRDLIWIGTDDGNVRYTTDGGGTWASNTSVSNRWITNVTADPADPQTAYYTTSGYRYGSTVGRIFRTNDMGDTWIDISGDLPDVPINDMIVNEAVDQLYVATDIGVYYTTDQGVSWDIMGQGLPEVVVTDLDFHAPTNKLLAATYGRSMFAIEVTDPVSTNNAIEAKFSATISPNPSQGQNNLALDILNPGTYKIQIFNSIGQLTNTLFDGHLSAGIQNISIDITSLPNGVYFCKIQSAHSGSKTLELVKID